MDEQSFGCQPRNRTYVAERVFDHLTERVYAAAHVRTAHRPPARHPRRDRNQHARARLSAQRARDRRGGRPHLPLHGAHPPGIARAHGLPAPRPHQAPCHRGAVRPQLGCRHRAPPGSPRAAGGRCRRRVERVGPGERRRGAAPAGRLRGRRRPVHAASARRLDDRDGHPRRRLRRRPRPGHGRQW